MHHLLRSGRDLAIGFLVFAVCGSIAWMAVIALIPAPWSMLAMIGVLAAYVWYFSGNGAPASTRAARRERFRSWNLDQKTWVLAGAAALLGVLVLQTGLHTLFRFIPYPAEDWRLPFDLSAAPVWMQWAFLVMASFVAALTEELGFRGYAQKPLEKRYGPALAIATTSLLFMVVHLNQAWAAPPVFIPLVVMGALWGYLTWLTDSILPAVLSHTVADIVNFSYWWTDVAGVFTYRPVFETGWDTHAVVSMAGLVVSVVAFLAVAQRIPRRG